MNVDKALKLMKGVNCLLTGYYRFWTKEDLIEHLKLGDGNCGGFSFKITKKSLIIKPNWSIRIKLKELKEK